MTDLNSAPAGPKALTGVTKLPALDFMRSDIVSETGPWRDSDPMDGSDAVEPVASLKRLFLSARDNAWDVYVFGRFYSEGNGTISISIKGPGGAISSTAPATTITTTTTSGRMERCS